MPDILSNLNSISSSDTAKPPWKRYIPYFIALILVGVSVGYMFSGSDIKVPGEDNDNGKVVAPETVTYDGVITYIDPRTFPGEEISFYLADAKGKTIILLKSDDKKLEVSQGLYATITGTVGKISSGKEDFLQVERIVIKNASN